MQIKFLFIGEVFFECWKTTKDPGCIQEIYLTKLKINILNTTYLKLIFLYKEVVLMNQMPPDT